MTDEARRRASDAPVAWIAAGLVVGLVAVGVGGRGLEAGVGYGVLGGALVAWIASRRR